MELRDLILSKINPKDFYKKILGYEFYGNVICPFHKDTNPSLQIKDDGYAYCYACKRGWKNIISFYMEYKDYSFTKTLYILYNDFIEPLISRKVYIDMFLELPKQKEPMAWLLSRGIGRKTINRYLLGYDHTRDRISLPIFNEWGYCVNIRFFRYFKNNEPKVISYKKGMGKCRLFPYTNLLHKEIYLFEGEMDTLLAIHLGLNAMTTTAGALSWRREFTNLFKDKIVYICYDNDQDGQKGAKIVAKELQRTAQKIYNIIIPKKLGKDFTDYMAKRPIEAFLNLVTKTREITTKDTESIERIKEPEDYSQEETMIVSLDKKSSLHIIVKVEPSD